MFWDMWKKSFDAWEDATAKYAAALMKNPVMLGSSAGLLTMMMKTKAASDRAKAAWWGEMGLSTKRDQERVLHLLNELQSRIMDLEEKLEDAKRGG